MLVARLKLIALYALFILAFLVIVATLAMAMRTVGPPVWLQAVVVACVTVLARCMWALNKLIEAMKVKELQNVHTPR